MHRLRQIWLVAAVALAATPAGAAELAGKPLLIASGPYGKITASITPDEDGGFAAIYSVNSDADISSDELFVRFYGSNRKPDGPAIRVDKVKKKDPALGLSFAGGAHLGSGRIIIPYASTPSSGGNPSFVAQLFKNGKKDGKPKTILPSFNYSYPPVELRDGRALLSWQANGDYDSFAFAAKNGDLPNTFKSFGANYNRPVALADGFLYPFLDGLTLRGRIYSAKGKAKQTVSFFTAASSSSCPRNTLVGLSTGDIALISCERDPATDRCAITAQLYSKTGVKRGKKLTLVKDAPNQGLTATYLPNGGMLASFTEDDGGKVRTVDRVLDKSLKLKGKVEEKRPAGAATYTLTTLTDGRVGIVYIV